MGTGALIAAAGLSSRMGAFKPMLPLGGDTIIRRGAKTLLAGGCAPDTPAAIVYKATWPDEKVYRCTVSTLAETARANHVTKTALITVGGFLGSAYDRSLLYDPGFSHGCREASK